LLHFNASVSASRFPQSKNFAISKIDPVASTIAKLPERGPIVNNNTTRVESHVKETQLIQKLLSK